MNFVDVLGIKLKAMAMAQMAKPLLNLIVVNSESCDVLGAFMSRDIDENACSMRVDIL